MATTVEVQDEAAKVIGWRLDQFMALGFDVRQAEELARRPGHEVDWHELRRWIKDLGMSVEDAYKVAA